MVGGEELVTRLEALRAEHGVDRRRRIGQPGQVARRRAEEFAQHRAGLVQQALQVPHEELHRLAFHPLSQLGLVLEHRYRAGAE